MSHQSTTELLALHGVRVLGGPSVEAIGRRYDLAAGEIRELLLDAQAHGWVNRHEFNGETWSLTELGRQENQRQLADELTRTGSGTVVAQVHTDFRPLNRRHGIASTNWQLRTLAGARVANDHSDPVWDDAVLVELEALDVELRQLGDRLSAALSRFDGHAQRHSAALARVRAGAVAWLDAPDRESCELVWLQLHEDLLATLGIDRGNDS